MEKNQEYYAMRIEEATKERYVLIQALKNYNYFFSDENKDDMVIFLAQQVSRLTETIKFLEAEQKI